MSNDFTIYEPGFRAYHKENHPTADDDTFERYMPAYQLGHRLATQPEQRNTNWETIEPEARRSWERDNDGPWEDFKDSVQHAWQTVKQKLSS